MSLKLCYHIMDDIPHLWGEKTHNQSTKPQPTNPPTHSSFTSCNITSLFTGHTSKLAFSPTHFGSSQKPHKSLFHTLEGWSGFVNTLSVVLPSFFWNCAPEAALGIIVLVLLVDSLAVSLQLHAISPYLSWRSYISLAAPNLKINRKSDSFKLIGKACRYFAQSSQQPHRDTKANTVAPSPQTPSSGILVSYKIHSHSKAFVMIRLWGAFWLQNGSLSCIQTGKEKQLLSLC